MSIDRKGTQLVDWQTIISRHSGIVWQTSWRLLRNEAEAADCYQDTFLAAIQVANREPVLNWPALLRSLATNHALTRLRRRHEVHPASDAVLAAMPAPQSNPADQAQAAELLERLSRSLAALTPQQAEVFCLRFFSDMTNEEIARELGITKSAVGVLLHRARSQIASMLAPVHESKGGHCHV